MLGVNTERKVHIDCEKGTLCEKLAFEPTRFQHNNDPILTLRVQTNHTLHLFFIFSLLCSNYVVD